MADEVQVSQVGIEVGYLDIDEVYVSQVAVEVGYVLEVTATVLGPAVAQM